MNTKHPSVRTSAAAILASLTLLFAHAASAQYITLTADPSAGKPSSETVNVASNELATVVHLQAFMASTAPPTGSILEIVSGGVTNKYAYISVTSTVPLPIIAGPASIRMTSIGGGVPGICTLQITKPTSTFVPVNTVVIPNDNGAPVQVILESSTDMVTWYAASPGTYGTSATNRFFRVRAQR